MPRNAACLLIGVAIIVSSLLAAAPAAAQQTPQIVAIEVTGNERIETATILAAVKSKVGDEYSQEKVDADAKAIKDLGWFFQVRSSAVVSEGGQKVTFQVTENSFISAVDVQGNTIFTDEQIAGVMETKAGQVLNNGVLARDVAADQGNIIKLYRNAGFPLVLLTNLSVETVEGRNVLKITVLEGTIEDVKVTGLTRTKAAVVLRELTVHPGEVFNQPRLRRDLERIFNLNLFEDVQAMPEAGTGPGQVIISVEVKEKKTGLASAGLGWSSVERLVGFVDVAESNFRGTGERVNLRAEFGGTKSWEAGYYNPWIAPKHTALNVAIYDKLTLREAFGEVESVLYYEKRGGGSVTLSRPVRSNTILSGTMRIDNLGVRQYQDQETPPDLSTLSQGRIRSITGMGTSDTRNLIANPSRGWYRSVSLEAAGFGGDSTFQKYGLDVRNYRPIFARRGMVAAARLLLGTASGNPPWLEQYLVGGGQTLRGYKEGRFPGTHMVVLNTELRVPFGKTISGVAFVDVGDAWGGSFAAEFGDAARKWHVGYGLGVRVITPIGPLRLDYGIGSEGAQTHFSVGQVF